MADRRLTPGWCSNARDRSCLGPSSGIITGLLTSRGKTLGLCSTALALFKAVGQRWLGMQPYGWGLRCRDVVCRVGVALRQLQRARWKAMRLQAQLPDAGAVLPCSPMQLIWSTAMRNQLLTHASSETQGVKSPPCWPRLQASAQAIKSRWDPCRSLRISVL